MNTNVPATKFDYAAIRANQPHASANLRLAVQWVMDLEGTYASCEPSLLPPGTTGSAQFDHCVVAINIKKAAQMSIDHAHAQNKEPHPNALIVAGMTETLVWKYAQIVLRQDGFDIRRGRIVGLLSDRSQEEVQQEGSEPIYSAEVAPAQTAYMQ